VLLAGFLALVRQRTGRNDLVIGTDVAGRSQGQAQRLVGLFVNQIVLRIDASGDPSFRAFVGRVRATALDAYAHDRVPFDKLVEALRPPRDPRYNPLFQIMFVLESAPLPVLTLAGLRPQIVEIDDAGSPFDLSVLLTEQGGLLRGTFRYSTSLFEAATIAAMVEDYAAVLATATARPEGTLWELSALVLGRAQCRKEAQAEALRAARLERFRTIPKR
jgi:non-ribosomal peptide synthetase component F